MNNRTDIKDVAKQAGVSISTVSRVLAGYPHVSSEKREQVLKAIKQLNYRPTRSPAHSGAGAPT